MSVWNRREFLSVAAAATVAGVPAAQITSACGTNNQPLNGLTLCLSVMDAWERWFSAERKENGSS